MNKPSPKALSIPRIPHQGWRLPWLQIAEGQHRMERHRAGLEDRLQTSLNDSARQMLISQAISRKQGTYFGSNIL